MWQNHSLKIQPGIQRIVLLYQRWQPLNTVVQNTVVPKVDFIKGIPSDLEDDNFFNSGINNFLRMDDHYLVLFNNPVDQQSVMTLARQIYLWHCDVFFKQFTKATKNPFGCHLHPINKD